MEVQHGQVHCSKEAGIPGAKQLPALDMTHIPNRTSAQYEHKNQ